MPKNQKSRKPCPSKRIKSLFTFCFNVFYGQTNAFKMRLWGWPSCQKVCWEDNSRVDIVEIWKVRPLLWTAADFAGDCLDLLQKHMTKARVKRAKEANPEATKTLINRFREVPWSPLGTSTFTSSPDWWGVGRPDRVICKKISVRNSKFIEDQISSNDTARMANFSLWCKSPVVAGMFLFSQLGRSHNRRLRNPRCCTRTSNPRHCDCQIYHL